MDKDVQQIYEYVTKMQDYYYGKLGGNTFENLVTVTQASDFQRVRYFIEEMEEVK